MGSGQVGLLWKALSEDKSTRGLAYAGPSTWCRPHFSVRIPEPAGTLLCHPWQSCSVCHFWQPLLCIEFWTPQEPRDWVGAWVQGMSACRHLASHLPGPAQTLNRISARVKQCGPRTISKQQGHQHKPPEQAVGMAMYPQRQHWVKMIPSDVSTGWTHTAGTWESSEAPPHIPSKRLPQAVFTVASASYHRQRQSLIL